MLDKLRKKLQGSNGYVVVAVLVLTGGYLLWTSISSTFGDNEVEAASKYKYFVCSETHKSFKLKMTENLSWPVESPYSGKKTGFPAEFCYWTKDGKISSTPTYVLVNYYLGKKGPTFCQECGRLVKAQNPPPIPGSPPPTEAEYQAKKGNADER